MASSPALDTGQLVTVSVYSDGNEIPATAPIVSVEVRKCVNRIPFAELVVLDGDMPNKDFPVSNADYFKPGCKIKIDAGYDSSEETLFEGVVVRHSIRISSDNFSRLIIECRDAALGMTIGRNNANFVDSKDSDIITKLIGNYSELSSDVDTTDTEYKELVQYYCTDWDFMLSRAEVNGLLVVVDAGKVSVKTPDTSGSAQLKVTYGEDLIDFQASLDARSQLSQVKSVSWDMKNQTVVEEVVAPETLNDQGNIDSSTLADVVGPSTFRLQTPAPMESEALKAWAKGQQVKSGLARIQGRMSFPGSAKAKLGELIELEGVGGRFNGSVFVSAVRHVVEDGSWITEVEFGMRADWFAESRDLVAPSASGLLPGIEGLHTGVVKKLDEDPDGQFKIQVSTPVMDAETDGVWAWLSKFYASNGIGAFFVPEIGDEVVLGYINNDPSNPIILGSLYSSSNTAPYELTTENNTKALVTRSKLKVEFDEDKKVITIITPGSNQVVISDDDKSILLQDQNGNEVKLCEDGISLTSPKDITIKADGKVSITASDNVEVDSQADFTASAMNVSQTADSGFTASGGTAEVSASGSTTIKGSTVAIN